VLRRNSDTAVSEETSAEEMLEEIQALSAKKSGNVKVARRILHLRQLAGIQLAMRADERNELVEPDFDALPDKPGLPEVTPDQLTPGLIRAAILKHGVIMVRGMLDPEGASRLGEEIDTALTARDTVTNGGSFEKGYYEEMEPEPPYGPLGDRQFVGEGGGMLAADSPKVALEVTKLFDQTNLRELVSGYLQESPAFSAQKTTLRKALPEVPGGFHQDGKFLGDVNSLNFWATCTHCGDEAPGLEIVPVRLEEIVDAGFGPVGYASIVVDDKDAEKIAGDVGIANPILEPGDAMFFDHLCLHKTGSRPEQPNPRYAIESWFFGPSNYPENYVPIAF
jgi:hypothetical protein